MAGGRFFGEMFPYDVYESPRTQPRGGYWRPRAPEIDQYWSREPGYGSQYAKPMRQPTAPYRNQEPIHRARARDNVSPRNVHEAKTVRTIPVEDGGACETPSQKASPVVRTRRATRFENVHAAATKIQAVYRGHAVRKTDSLKHLRIVCKVRTELKELMRKSGEPEQSSKLCRDPQERLRWTEGIMALLLRLDSLQGVHPVVRDIRKSVAKEAIKFQERIDSLSRVCTENIEHDKSSMAERGDGDEVEKEEEVGVKDVGEPTTLVAESEEPHEEVRIETEDKSLGYKCIESEGEVKRAEDSSETKDVQPPEEPMQRDCPSGRKIDAVDDGLQAVQVIAIPTPEQQMPHVEPLVVELEKPDETISASTSPFDNPSGTLPSRSIPEKSVVEETTSFLHPSDSLETSAKTDTRAAMHVEDEAQTVKEVSVRDVKEEAMAMEGNVIKGGLAVDLEGEDDEIKDAEDGEAIANVGEVFAELTSEEEKSAASATDANVAEWHEEAINTRPQSPHVPDESTDFPSEVSYSASMPLELPQNVANRQEKETATSPAHACDGTIVAGDSAPWTSVTPEPQSNVSLQLCLAKDSSIADATSSDRALLQQILEENRQLRAVVGKVLQWGKQQNDIIHNLANRIEQLEGNLSDATLLHNTNESRKKIGSNRRLEKGGRKGKNASRERICYIDPDEHSWPSSSEEFF